MTGKNILRYGYKNVLMALKGVIFLCTYDIIKVRREMEGRNMSQKYDITMKNIFSDMADERLIKNFVSG